jgi:4-aminobutyrate aminotransferase-like enzyme
MIQNLGPQNVAAIITEIISGGGLVVSPPEWIKGLRDLTRKYGVLWIDDEVMTGLVGLEGGSAINTTESHQIL